MLVATIMVAGMFAFMPVNEATTTHTILQASNLKLVALEQTCTALADNDCQTVNIDVPTGADFVLLSVSAIGTTQADANDDYDLQVPTVLGDTATGCDMAKIAVTAVTTSVTCSLGGTGIAGNDIVFVDDDTGTQESGDVIEVRAMILVEGDAGTVTMSIPV